MTPTPGSAVELAHRELMAGDIAAARTALQEALQSTPRDAAVHNLIGFIALREGRFAEAEPHFREAVALEPASQIYKENLDLARSMSQARAPAAALRTALAGAPERPQLWHALASAETEVRGAAAAVSVLQEGLVHCPDEFSLLHALARTLHQIGRLAEAAIYYRYCLKLDVRSVEARIGLSLACQRLLRLDDAERWAHEAVELAPGSAPAQLNLGAVLYLRRRFREAISCFERALGLRPDEPRASNQLGMARTALGDAEGAVDDFRRAVSLKPDYSVARSNLMLALLYCDKVTGEDIFREARRYAEHAPAVEPAVHSNAPDPSRRLRIGFVSGDFRRHVVGTFLLPLFARRDRGASEFLCYSMVDVPDPMTQMLAAQADGWTDVRAMDDTALAARIKSDRIDLLVDPSGHTSDNRLSMFARRPAPVQATWLGFPGTTGAPGIDYRLTDAVLDPPGSEAQSTEEPLRLGCGYFCYAPLPEWGGGLQVAALPAQRAGHITFGAFNNLAKVSPSCFDSWAEVLRQVPESKLICRAKPFDDERERLSFKEHFVRRRVAAERIDTRPYLPDPAQHLRIYDEVDVHLDSMPYSGGATTCDALWMGVPVVALAGDRPSARLSASVLASLGLDELIAGNSEQYVRVAVSLARDIERLAALRSGMRARFTASPQHDGTAFAAAFERACRAMWRRWCRLRG